MGGTVLPARLTRAFPRLYQLAYDKFRVDELYQALILEPIGRLAYTLWRVVDVFVIDGLLVNVIARGIGWASSLIRLFQNGDLQRYAALMAVAAAVILWTIVGGH